MLTVVVILCSLSVISEIFLFSNLFTITNEYDTILNTYVADEEEMLNTCRMMYKIQSMAAAYIFYEEDSKVEEAGAQIDELDVEIMQVLGEFKSKFGTGENSTVFHTLYSDYISYKSHEEMARSLAIEGSTQTAQYYVNTIMAQKLESINESIDGVYNVVNDKIVSAKKNMENFKTVVWILCVAVAAVMVVGIIILVRIFTRSSSQIVDTYDKEKARHYKHIIKMQRSTIEGMAELVESRDGTTGGHVKRTANYVVMLANKLKEQNVYTDILTDKYIERLGRFAPLHDIGKIIVPDEVLLKPGKYTQEEYNEMKKHTVAGAEIVRNILHGTDSEECVKMAVDIAHYHHERWDGQGYPSGLSKDDIPLCARIMAVADVYDALVSERCYKAAFEFDKASAIIEEAAGTHLDPYVVNAFVALKNELNNMLQSNGG